MLTSEERETAARAIALVIMSNPRPLIIAMVADVEFGLTFKSAAQDPMGLAHDAISKCLAEGWTPPPPWIEQLLAKVVQTPQIAVIRTRIAKAPAPKLNGQLVLANLFDTQVLPPSRVPFVDRVPLRRHLRNLDAATGPSVLIVNGPEKYGKSYTIELVYHIARHTNQLRQDGRPLVAVIPFQQSMGASLSPEVLANLIVQEIRCQDPKPLDTGSVTPDRVNDYLVDWIVENLEGQSWWLVLDNLDDKDLPQATRNFITKLVELVSTGKHKKKFRLIVTNYPPDKIYGVPLADYEREDLGRIGEVDLEPFFTELLREPNGNPPSDRAVRTAAKLVLLGLPEDNTRHAVLNQKLSQVAANV